MPWTNVGFVIMAISGALLFYEEPVRFYGNIFFRLKLIALVLAGINAAIFHSSRPANDSSSGTAARSRRRRPRSPAISPCSCGRASSSSAASSPTTGSTRSSHIEARTHDFSPFLVWLLRLDRTHPSRARRSGIRIWQFAAIEAVHLLALAVIGGAVLIVDLRLLGWTLGGSQ